MDDTELQAGLKGNGWTLSEACAVIELRTKAVITPKHVRMLLDTQGRLSNPLTAAFRFLFQGAEKEKHHDAAP